jgi:pimeloyl-ACP methyl ester carboxylesterase
MEHPSQWTDDPVRTRDGRTLFAQRAGSGSPVVVFESGLGVSRNMWGRVAPLVAERTTAVVYDRSGLGRSAADPSRRDLRRLAGDLLDVVDHLGGGPVVLVGHSWGGPVVRTAAARRPEAVAGLVLVDPTDELCEVFFSRANQLQTRLAGPMFAVMSRMGALRKVALSTAKDLPEPWASAMRAEDGTAVAASAAAAELRGSVEDLRRLRVAPAATPAVPVTVIGGQQASRLERGRRSELLEAYRSRAAACAQGRFVLAERSGHMAPVQEPELVAAEVLALVDPGRSALVW